MVQNLHMYCVHTAGVDYISAFATLTLTNTVDEVCLVVVTLDDDTQEGSETFNVFLISTDPTVDVVRSNATGVILDEVGRFLQYTVHYCISSIRTYTEFKYVKNVKVFIVD